jgi:hypothetical protein
LPAAQLASAVQDAQLPAAQTPLWQLEAERQAAGVTWPHWPLLPQTPEEQWLPAVQGVPLVAPGVQVPAAQYEPVLQSVSSEQPVAHTPALQEPERQSPFWPQGLPAGWPQTLPVQRFERQSVARTQEPPLGAPQRPSTGEQKPLRQLRPSLQGVPEVEPHLPSAPQTLERQSRSAVHGAPGSLPQTPGGGLVSQVPERHCVEAVQVRLLGSPHRSSVASQVPERQRVS